MVRSLFKEPLHEPVRIVVTGLDPVIPFFEE